MSDFKTCKKLILQAAFLLMFSSLLGCKKDAIPLSSLPAKTPKINPAETFMVNIKGHNLSEDLSRILSTKNDELLIFIYQKKDSGSLDAPLLQKTLELDSQNKEKHFIWDKKDIPEGQDLLFLLLEQDFDTPIEQIDPILRIHYLSIIDAFKKRDYQKIRTYLGTEDFLGYKTIENFSFAKAHTFNIKGVYKLDLYEYEISISTNWAKPAGQ